MRRSFGVALTLATIVVSNPARAAVVESCAYDLHLVTTAINDFLAVNPQIPGLGFQIDRKGTVIYQGTFGSYTPNTVVPIASATKWISGVIIMSLVDDGVITLDQTIGTYLPSFASPPLDTITFGQCFSHTSGLPGTSQCHVCLGDRTTTLQTCAASIAGGGVNTTPGTDFAYGGCSMQAAGAAVEVASGTSWRIQFLTRLKLPLGLTSMSYGLSANPRIAGGAISSMGDYAAMLRMILNRGTFNGNQVLSPQAAEMLLADRVGNLSRSHVPPGADPAYGYAIGNWVNAVDQAGRSVQSSSEGAFGFSPWIDRTRDIACVFLVADSNLNVQPLVRFIQARVRQAVDTSPDIDGDGVVAFSDITAVVAHWLEPSAVGQILGPGPIGDVDGSGAVDFGDITGVIAAWGCTGP